MVLPLIGLFVCLCCPSVSLMLQSSLWPFMRVIITAVGSVKEMIASHVSYKISVAEPVDLKTDKQNRFQFLMRKVRCTTYDAILRYAVIYEKINHFPAVNT